MTLLYKPVQANLPSADGKKKWHPHLVKNGTVDLMKIAEEIAERSSLTPGDVYNVILNLFSSVNYHLMDSKTVKLDTFGRFTVKAHSEGNGVDTAEEVNHEQISYLTIQFSPVRKRVFGRYIMPMLSGATFKRVKDFLVKKK